MNAQINPRWHDTEGSGRQVLSAYAIDMMERSLDELRNCPQVLTEVCLDDEQAAISAHALAKRDFAGFASAYIDARDAYVDEMVAQRQNERPWLSEMEAIDQLVAVYSP